MSTLDKFIKRQAQGGVEITTPEQWLAYVKEGDNRIEFPDVTAVKIPIDQGLIGGPSGDLVFHQPYVILTKVNMTGSITAAGDLYIGYDAEVDFLTVKGHLNVAGGLKCATLRCATLKARDYIQIEQEINVGSR